MHLDLLETLAKLREKMDAAGVKRSRDAVLGEFGPIFKPETIGKLKRDEFKKFLRGEHNKHWSGLSRQPKTYEDMPLLRRLIKILLDESKPIQERFDEASVAPGMGKAKITAILLVAYPDKYGVWNNTSERALVKLGLWPKFPRGATKGEKYDEINIILKGLADWLDIDLWTLDTLWWGLDLNEKTPISADHKLGKWSESGIDKAVSYMVRSIIGTTKNSNGQVVTTRIKNKDLLISPRKLSPFIKDLILKQGERCAITGIPFTYDNDAAFFPSADRIDSSGHYERDNIQIVCRFVNFWKQATPDADFRRLLKIVRESKASTSREADTQVF